jgi:hypothetical protein
MTLILLASGSAASGQKLPTDGFHFISHEMDFGRRLSVDPPAPDVIEQTQTSLEKGEDEIGEGADTDPQLAADLLMSVKIGEVGDVSIDHRKFQPIEDSDHMDLSSADPGAADDDEPIPAPNKFHWGPAIRQSMILLGIQHGYAVVAQEKTRRALAHGNFFGDYWRSVKAVRGWDDGNRFATNYVAHPMQGALTGFIYAQNHERLKRQKFGESKQYWNDRFKALLWSTAWSTQFELGPISQSSIGNVGMYGHMGYVDLVVTPTVGTAWMVTEEAMDRYVIRHVETNSFFVKMMTRMFLNPMRTIANLLRFKEPWYRDRPLGH